MHTAHFLYDHCHLIQQPMCQAQVLYLTCFMENVFFQPVESNLSPKSALKMAQEMFPTN